MIAASILVVANIFVLVVIATAGMWWLSGQDPKLTGENNSHDIVRRSIRCGFGTLLFIILISLPTEHSSLLIVLFIGGLLALIWTGCIIEALANGFHHLTGMAASDEEFDPRKSVRKMEMVARLIRDGRNDEALELYETLEESGDGDAIVLEALLDRAGIPHEKLKQPKPLLEAGRLRAAGKFAEAEMILKSLLEQNPSNASAAMMLMRLYVQDFKRSDKAMEILRALQSQPHIPAAQIEYAQRSIHDWGRKKVEARIELPETVEELLAAGYFGTAIEMLEQKAVERPDNFEAQLKLAEAYGLHSRDISKAKKIIESMEKKSIFSAEQIRIAKAGLNEWCEAKPPTK